MRIWSLAFLLLFALPAHPQAFPSKPVRIIVVYPPGGTSDAVTRLLADKLAPALGQQVLVENRGGAGGAIGMDAMAKSAPDGHTLAFSAISPLTLLPHVGIFAPGRTPPGALKRLHEEINAALASPEVAERLVKLDNVVAPLGAEQFAQVVRREYEANAKIVARAGIRSDQ